MRQLMVIPIGEFGLFRALVKKESELRRRKLGTWRRSGTRESNRARWKHSRYPGWVKLARGMGEVVQIEVRCPRGMEESEWQLLDSILGFLDRHFAENISSVHIYY